MDAYEATRIVFSRIQSLDPENASKIMGLLLIQDHGEKEMIRLAFGPEALLHSVILKARKDLGLSPSTPSTPSSPSPFFSSNNSISISRQNSSSFSSSRLLSNLSPSSSSWAPPSTYSDVQNLEDLINSTNLTTPTTTTTLSNNHNTTSASYAAVVAAMNGFNNHPSSTNNMVVGSSTTTPSELIIDDFQLQDQLSYLDGGAVTMGPKNSDLFYPPPPQAADLAGSPNNNSDAMLFPPYWAGASAMNNGNHRRSCSVTDMCLGSSDPLGSSLGWKPCLYFARGYCKNGSSCRFLHGLPDSPDSNSLVGSPSKLDVMEQCQELLLLRSKTQQQQQQQQLRSQLLASSTFPYSPTGANSKCMNFLLQQQNDTQRAALMLGEDAHKFSSRSRIERSDYLNSLGGMVMNPGSRQIYLTFPADSTFREEDVSNYFSIYGPVQDVRIPYQQKRMFGFVTFVYPETVKLILAKGNPHFVCDARVLVKPYKEKGKVPDKKQQQQQQQMERGEFSVCTTPTGLDSRDPYDLQLGGRMFNTNQDMLLRRKLEEQVELQKAIELQSRRFMGLQLLDVKKQYHHHQRNLSSPSPTHPYSPHFNNNPISASSSSDRSSPESSEDNCMSPANREKQGVKVNGEKEEICHDDNSDGNGKVNGKESPKHDETDFHNGLEHNLPDSPFASPTKSGSSGDAPSFFSTTMAASAAPSINNNGLMSASSLLPPSSLDMPSFKSCFFQIPRFSSDHGAIGM